MACTWRVNVIFATFGLFFVFFRSLFHTGFVTASIRGIVTFIIYFLIAYVFRFIIRVILKSNGNEAQLPKSTENHDFHLVDQFHDQQDAKQVSQYVKQLLREEQ
jgi:hypothetical protein